MTDPEKLARTVNPTPGDSAPSNSKRFNWLNLWPSELPQLYLFIWLWTIPIICALGVGVMLIYSSQVPSGVRWSVFGTALVIGGSAYFTGGIVGFLFGVPRTVQGSPVSKGITQYQGNTNLEQVSDWLTKIIVGIGLVQIGRIVPALSKFAESMKAPLGGLPSSGAFGLGLAISYALLGFFYFYFWSRSLFARELGTFDAAQQQNGVNESDQSTTRPRESPACAEQERTKRQIGSRFLARRFTKGRPPPEP